MSEQQVMEFDYAYVKAMESIYTLSIEQRLKKFAWADKLFASDGTRKFTIVFAAGKELEFRVEVTSLIKLVICGLSVIPGGQTKIESIDTIQRTMSVLQACAKHVRSTSLTLRRETTVAGKRFFSSFELSDKMLAIPEEDAEVVKTEVTIRYIVKDLKNGNVVDVVGMNEPAGALLFNARVKLNGLRRDDD